MFPFYPQFINPFMPFPFPRRSRSNVLFLDSVIPQLTTTLVTVDTTANTVTYGLNACQWNSLRCNEGLILLNVVHTASGATAGSTVSIDPTPSNKSVVPNTSVSKAIALTDGLGVQMATEQVTANNRYFVYYNKQAGIFQIVNNINTATTEEVPTT